MLPGGEVADHHARAGSLDARVHGKLVGAGGRHQPVADQQVLEAGWPRRSRTASPQAPGSPKSARSSYPRGGHQHVAGVVVGIGRVHDFVAGHRSDDEVALPCARGLPHEADHLREPDIRTARHGRRRGLRDPVLESLAACSRKGRLLDRRRPAVGAGDELSVGAYAPLGGVRWPGRCAGRRKHGDQVRRPQEGSPG